MNYREALIGRKFHKLTVESLAFIDHRGGTVWKCHCDCGRTKQIRGDSLRRNKVKSCGCLIATTSKQRAVFVAGEIPKWWWGTMKRGARIDRNLEFTITPDYAWKLFVDQGRVCALSGIPLALKTSKLDCNRNASIDRIDSTKGYVVGNVQWVDKDINRMKQIFGQHKFVHLCRLVSAHASVV